jgi:hypothetical protein
LLDTNVLNRWVESTDPDARFTSVLSLGEIRKGIELLVPGNRWDYSPPKPSAKANRRAILTGFSLPRRLNIL